MSESWGKWGLIDAVVLLSLALVIPLVHYSTFTAVEDAGMGFDILFYEPFSGAPSIIPSSTITVRYSGIETRVPDRDEMEYQLSEGAVYVDDLFSVTQ